MGRTWIYGVNPGCSGSRLDDLVGSTHPVNSRLHTPGLTSIGYITSGSIRVARSTINYQAKPAIRDIGAVNNVSQIIGINPVTP